MYLKFLIFLDFEEQLEFNKNFEEKLTSLYKKKIQRYEIFEKEESLETKRNCSDSPIYEVKKIPENDTDFVRITKLIFGFRENPEFLFRLL